MKTSSKRRVLVSSVSMLLVSMLALGTATFAWFTQNTEATADGIAAKSVKTSSLELSKQDFKWSSSINYAVGKFDANGNITEYQTFFPTSSNNGTNWFYAKAAEVDASTISGNAKAVPTESIGHYVYKEMLNIKNAGTEGDIKDITIAVNFGDTADAEYARVALVPCAKPTVDENGAGKSQGVALTAAPTDFADQVIGFNKNVFDKHGVAYNAVTDVSGGVENIQPRKCTSADQYIQAGTLKPQQERYYNLYVWFEGQDVDCYDAKVGQTIDNLKITVKGTPADA